MVRFDFTSGSLPAGATFTRASGAAYFDASGVEQFVNANVPRFDHVPRTGVYRGLLLEPAATNYALNSNKIYDPATWNYTGTSVAIGSNALVESNAVEFHWLTQTYPTGAGLNWLSARVATLGNGPPRNFGINTPGGAGLTVFDPATGQVVYRNGNIADVFIERISDTIWHFGVAFDNGPNTGGAFVQTLGIVQGATGQVYQGNGTSGLLISYVQNEYGSRPTSRIDVQGAPATRAADVLTLDFGSQGVADGDIAAFFTYADGVTSFDSLTVAQGHAVVRPNPAGPWVQSIAYNPSASTTSPGRALTLSEGATPAAFAQAMDPSDLVDFIATLSQGSSATDLLENGEGVASFTLAVTAEAVAAGLSVRNDGAYNVALNGLVLKFWAEVAEQMRSNARFNNDGVTLSIELTFITDATPPRRKQRTLAIKVSNR